MMSNFATEDESLLGEEYDHTNELPGKQVQDRLDVEDEDE
jgi:hypothetical protein